MSETDLHYFLSIVCVLLRKLANSISKMNPRSLPVLILFLFLSAILHAQNAGSISNGLKITKDNQQHFFLANENEVQLISMDSIPFNVDSVIADINRSQISDRMLIVRVLQMHSNPAEKRTELLNMTQTYNEIAAIVLRRSEPILQKRYTPQEMDAMKQRKK